MTVNIRKTQSSGTVQAGGLNLCVKFLHQGETGMLILPAASKGTDYHCYQFRAGTLLRAISFADSESAKAMAVTGLSWNDCDRIELWHSKRKMLEMVCGPSQMSVLRTALPAS